MIITLQWYIFREMGKTFVLTAIGLTLVFTLGGGVLNMIRVEGVTARQAMLLLGFVLPVATALTLPVAALFAAAMCYGRLSADNEINACRSSGINVNRLFAPALALSVASGLFTFYFSNFVIPHFVRGLDARVRKDLAEIVTGELRTTGHLKFRQYVMHADRLQEVPTEQLAPGTKQFEVFGTHVMELDGDDLARYFMADRALLTFEMASGTIRCDLLDVAVFDFDPKRNQSFQAARQAMGPFAIPQSIRMKEKWFDLPDLLRYRNEPQDLPEVRDQLERLREIILEAVVYRSIEQAVDGGKGAFRWGPDGQIHELRAEQCRLNPGNLRPSLYRPSLIQSTEDGPLRVTADEARLQVVRRYGQPAPDLHIALEGNVKRIDPREPDRPIFVEKYEPTPAPVPAELVARVAELTDARLLGYGTSLGLGGRADHVIDERRESLAHDLEYRVRRITGIIHSRAAFAASVLLLVPLGAALGVIFRGGQVMTAFGISFVPGLFVTVIIIMGRQLTENAATSGIGVAVIWGGLAAMGATDLLVMTRWMRR